MCRIKAILFDWGGTLCSTQREEEVFCSCARAAGESFSKSNSILPPGATEALERIFRDLRQASIHNPQLTEMNLISVFDAWFADQGISRPEETIVSLASDAFWSEWTTCLDLLDEADQVLQRLKQCGFKLGLVSNVAAPQKFCTEQLERLGFLEHLDTITVSSAVGYRKPHRFIYKDALKKMGHAWGQDSLPPSEVMFVGDSPLCDIMAPKELGMKTTLITHPKMKSSLTTEEFGAIRSDYLITHLSQLESLLS